MHTGVVVQVSLAASRCVLVGGGVRRRDGGAGVTTELVVCGAVVVELAWCGRGVWDGITF